MPKKKLGIREILAHNLKENRQKCGLTQEKLAEKAGISSNYLSMVEVSKKFPTPEMLDRLANALDIETFQLFDTSATAEGALLHLELSIINRISLVIKDTIKETIYEEYKHIKKENK
ncbi:MAG: helix-turn-helix transcriptional regulator [Treponema sp.]|nr:helix-turn-helix transcriptional regulator [Treponema sp.]